MKNLSVRSASHPLKELERVPAADHQMTEAFVGALMMTVVQDEASMTSAVPGVALMTSAAPDAVWTTIVDLEGDSMMSVVHGAAWTNQEAPDVVLMMTGVPGEVVVKTREAVEGEVMTPGLGNLWADQVRKVYTIFFYFFVYMASLYFSFDVLGQMWLNVIFCAPKVVGERGRRPVRRAGVLPVTPVLMMRENKKERSVTRENVSESVVRPGTRA